MTPFAAARDLADQAIPCFPCGDSKAPLCAGGFRAATLDHEPATWHRAALIGMPTGGTSGFDVLDIDPRHGGNDWLAANEYRLPPTRRVQTRSGGTHFYFRAHAGLASSVAHIAPGVDIRAEGGYVIRWDCAGYAVDSADIVAAWPTWLLEAAAPRRVQRATESGRDVSAPSAVVVVDILDRMPNPAETDRDTYLRVMMAARGCGDDPAIAEAAVRWADRWPGSPGADVETEKWERDFALRDAPLAGWQNLLAAAARLGVDVSAARAAGAGEFGAIAAAPVARAGKVKMRDRLLRPADCATSERRGYIVKGLLAPGDVAAIIGAPSTGKSTLAPFMAYAVAQGRPVFGLRTKPGRVLYVAAEDFAGMRQRVDALRRTHGDAPDFALAETGSLLDRAAAIDLMDTVAQEKPALVVIDTVGAAWAGMDENDSAGMGEVVALARRVAATGSAVILLHHIAKNGDGTPRGHSALNGTLDMCLSLAAMDENRIVRGKLTKNRNGWCDLDIAFRSAAIVLGTDEDGDDITAPMAAELAGLPEARGPKLSPRESHGLAILRDLDIGAGADEQAWRDACDDQRVCATDNAANRIKVVSKVLRTLIDKGALRAAGGLLFIAEQPEQPGTTRNSGRAVPAVPSDRISDLAA